MKFCVKKRVVFRREAVTTPCVVRHEGKQTFSEVTAVFNDKVTAPSEPVLLDLFGSSYRLGKCLLPPHNYDSERLSS